MAKKQIQLSIADPCTENWQLMTPNDKGKFCASCQKTVVDFSTMTDAEVIHYFENYKGATCGRFTEKQLSAPMSVTTFGKPQSHWAWALSALLLPSFATSQTVKTAESVSIVETYPSVKKGNKMINDDSGKVKDIKLHGIVADTSGSPLVGASVVLKGTTIGTACDIDGKFEFTIPFTSIDGQDFEIVVSAVGYETQILKLNSSFGDKVLYLCLLVEDSTLLGDLIVIAGGVSYSRPNAFQRTKYFFKRLFRKIKS